MLLNSILGTFFFTSLVLGGPVDIYTGVGHHKKCNNPRIRKSWHHLKDEEKLDYTRAVKCLFESPSQGSSYFPAAVTRYDDFVSLHINQTGIPDPKNITNNNGVFGPGIHRNGVFLPWHRYLVWSYEEALINECNYKGAQPYWEWSLDNPEFNSTMAKSPIFDPITGFGSNGAGGSVPDIVPANAQKAPAGSCIADGPFAGITNNLGFGYNLNVSQPHCIIRNFNVTRFEGSGGWSNAVKPILKVKTFAEFTIKTDVPGTGAPGGIHSSGHGGVNGEMRNVWSSINDPLFFMHHAQLDHVWWSWQNLKPEHKFAIDGPVYPNGTGGKTTLDYTVQLAPFVAPDVKIRDLMDSQNKNNKGVLCYVYQDTGHENPYED